MGESYFEQIKAKYILTAMRTNDCAEERDTNRNHTNYGSASTWGEVLKDMGHKIETSVWEDGNGCLRIPCVSIDEENIEFQKGKEEK